MKTSIWNGPTGKEKRKEEVEIGDEAIELLKPFKVAYSVGRVENISVETEPLWATNIKQSIAGIFQLDIVNIRQELASAFNSIEVI